MCWIEIGRGIEMKIDLETLTELINETMEEAVFRPKPDAVTFEWIAQYDGWSDSIIQDIVTNPQLFQIEKLTKNTPYSFMVEVLTNDFLENKFRTAPELFSGGDTITQLKPYNLSKTMKKNPFDTLHIYGAYKDLYDVLQNKMQIKAINKETDKMEPISLRHVLGSNVLSKSGGGTSPHDVQTDLALIHVKFNEESSEPDKRLTTLQKPKGMELDLELCKEDKEAARGWYKALEKYFSPTGGEWFAELKNRFVDRLKESGLTDTIGLEAGKKSKGPKTVEVFMEEAIQPDGMLRQGKGPDKDNPKIKKDYLRKGRYQPYFELLKKEYNALIYANKEKFLKQLEKGEFKKKTLAWIEDNMIPSREPPPPGLGNREVVWLRYFFPTTKDPSYQAGVKIERVKWPQTDQTFKNVEDHFEFEYTWLPSGFLRPLIYLKGTDTPVIAIEMRGTDGQRHCPQIKSGENFADLKTSFQKQVSSESNFIPAISFQRVRDAEAYSSELPEPMQRSFDDAEQARIARTRRTGARHSEPRSADVHRQTFEEQQLSYVDLEEMVLETINNSLKK